MAALARLRLGASRQLQRRELERNRDSAAVNEVRVGESEHRDRAAKRTLVVSASVLAALVVCFFVFLNLTLTDSSWGDITFEVQVAYNFVHGRPFNTSVYRLS